MARRYEAMYYRFTEEYLTDYRLIKASIIANQKKIEFINETLLPSGVSNYGVGTGGHPTGRPNSTLKWVIVREQAAKFNPEICEYQRRIKDAQLLIEAIDGAMSKLSDIQRNLILKRYFENKRWTLIANEVALSVNRCLDWKKRAVKKIAIGIFGPKAIGIHGQNRGLRKYK